MDGVVIDDEQDFQSFLENNHQYWDYVDEDLEASMKGKSRITFYLPADGDGFDQLAHLRTALQGFKDAHAGKYGPLLMTLENLKDADWENNWKQYYKPMEIGERLLVIPEWEQENVKGQAKYAGKVPLILEPGLTFGTGSHATTRLCLTALEEAVHGGETVLDLGCGSGILSIAALRLGAVSAKAVDIDDKCLTVAYENAALNLSLIHICQRRTGQVNRLSISKRQTGRALRPPRLFRFLRHNKRPGFPAKPKRIFSLFPQGAVPTTGQGEGVFGAKLPPP